ncbi:gliding motility lipoprotein GldH [Phocaeicola sp.]
MKSRNFLHRIKNSRACLPACLLLAACHSNTVYHSYQPVATAGWDKGDTLVYTLPASVPAGTYEAEIGVRHQEAYPYRDLWVSISRNMQDTLIYTTDTLQVFLADETGNWKGDGPGGLYQLTQVYQPKFTITGKGSSRSIRIVHIMKDKPLIGVSDIGIRLRKTSE